MEIQADDDGIVVISPIDSSPAHRAGIKAGDRIIAIDDKSAKGITTTEAVKRIRGKKGTTVKLTIRRKGVDEPLDFEIVRDEIKLLPVERRMLAPGYGYVRIKTFSKGTHRHLLETSPIYQEIYRSQLGADVAAEMAEVGLKGTS